MHLLPDFKDFIQLLNEEKVEYLLIGGYAVGFHGRPRYTQDIDFWVAAHPANAVAIGQVMKRFGCRDPASVSGEFLKPKCTYQFGVPPFRIDILTAPSGVDFSECYARRDVIERDGIEISIISIEDLRVNKAAAGRGKDVGDLDELSSL
jgi:hypothetical protein